MFKAVLKLNKRVGWVALCSKLKPPSSPPKFNALDISLNNNDRGVTCRVFKINAGATLTEKCGLKHDPTYPPLL